MIGVNNTMQLLKRLLLFLTRKKEEVDMVHMRTHEGIYVELRLALNRLSNSHLDLSMSTLGSGRLEMYAKDLNGYIKSLTEVIHVLKENTHIDEGIFFTRDTYLVSFDDFMFVQNGYYSKDVITRLSNLVVLMDDYCLLMSGSDDAKYGYREYNHRKLYRYTQLMTTFINTLVDVFDTD